MERRGEKERMNGPGTGETRRTDMDVCRLRTAIESVDPGQPGQTSRAQVLHPGSWRVLQAGSVNVSPFHDSAGTSPPLLLFPSLRGSSSIRCSLSVSSPADSSMLCSRMEGGFHRKATKSQERSHQRWRGLNWREEGEARAVLSS